LEKGLGVVVGAFFVPHDPLVFLYPDAAGVDTRKRVRRAYADVAELIDALQPDVAIIVGADHYINFGPGCLPQYLIGVGEVSGPLERFPGVPQGALASSPLLARYIAESGFADGFDWAVAKVINVDHSVGLPARLCLKPLVSVIPVYLASGVDPFLTLRRAYDLGRSILRAVQAWPHATRVVAIGSGGLSHWVGVPEQGRVNPDFDSMILRWLVAGNAERMIALTDAEITELGGNGAMEIRNFLCAMAMVPDAEGKLIAYEPVPEWITGLGFAELRPR
jgi:protocatechuate 4,5-dioxygenase beta chain